MGNGELDGLLLRKARAMTKNGALEQKSLVLLSGGMDSAVTLYIALRESRDVEALVFDYGQRSRKEIDCAIKVAQRAGVKAHLIRLPLNSSGSVLTDAEGKIPGAQASNGGRIPSTYVPARNLVFLSFALNWAESTEADALYIGAHQLDYSNYPDCRGEFFDRFADVVSAGTRSGVEGRPVRVVTPVLDLTKKEIVLLGLELGVPFEETWSCYERGDEPCSSCESCSLRAKAFREAGSVDPQRAENKNTENDTV